MADAPTDSHPSTWRRTPVWVKMFGAVITALVVVVAVMMLLGGGRHGPGRHLDPGHTPPTGTSGIHQSDHQQQTGHTQ